MRRLLNNCLMILLCLLVAGIVAPANGFTKSKKAKIRQLKKLSSTKRSLKVKRPVKSSGIRVRNAAVKRGVLAYRQGKMAEAVNFLDNALNKSKLSRNDRKVAAFFMGKALFNLRFYYASVPYFQEIVAAGPNHLFYPFAFQRLIWVVNRDNKHNLLTDLVAPKSGRKTRVQVPARHRNSVFYMLAKAYFERNAFNKARSMIRRIESSSDTYHEGQLLEALMAVRSNRNRAALDAFSRASKSSDEDIRGLAFLGLARVYYGQRNDKQAITNFDRVEKSSRYWLIAQSEMAWALYRSKQQSIALGALHPFDTRSFGGVFAPEASIIKSTIFFRLCKYEDAEAAILPFFKNYEPVYRRLETFQAKYRGRKNAYRNAILKLLFDQTNELPEVLTNFIFNKTWFENRLNQLRSIKTEIDNLSRNGALRRTNTGDKAISSMRASMNGIANEVIKAAVPLLRKWHRKLIGYYRHASLIRFEAAYAGIDYEKTKSRISYAVPKNPEYEIWKFDDEYWGDEVGEYRYLLRSECEIER